MKKLVFELKKAWRIFLKQASNGNYLNFVLEIIGFIVCTYFLITFIFALIELLCVHIIPLLILMSILIYAVFHEEIYNFLNNIKLQKQLNADEKYRYIVEHSFQSLKNTYNVLDIYNLNNIADMKPSYVSEKLTVSLLKSASERNFLDDSKKSDVIQHDLNYHASDILVDSVETDPYCSQYLRVIFCFRQNQVSHIPAKTLPSGKSNPKQHNAKKEPSVKMVADEPTSNSLGKPHFILWEYNRFPHMLIFGSTGSGKTFQLILQLYFIIRCIPNSQLILCDYKGDDFFRKVAGCYHYADCILGLRQALDILHERQQHPEIKCHFVCFAFDEWASFLNSLDKKTAEQAKADLGQLVMLGRSFNIHVIISQQRLDADYFSKTRDNYSVIIGMGKLSKESVSMMFNEYKEDIQPNKEQRYGSLLVGANLYDVFCPDLPDEMIAILPKLFEHGINRNFQPEDVPLA